MKKSEIQSKRKSFSKSSFVDDLIRNEESYKLPTFGTVISETENDEIYNCNITLCKFNMKTCKSEIEKVSVFNYKNKP